MLQALDAGEMAQTNLLQMGSRVHACTEVRASRPRASEMRIPLRHIGESSDNPCPPIPPPLPLPLLAHDPASGFQSWLEQRPNADVSFVLVLARSRLG
jgi:hypothetical protein